MLGDSHLHTHPDHDQWIRVDVCIGPMAPTVSANYLIKSKYVQAESKEEHIEF